MEKSSLRLKNLGIRTDKTAIVFMRKDCPVCLSEGVDVHARVKITLRDKVIVATLNTVSSAILAHGEASLSEYAWEQLGAIDGDEIYITHAMPVNSLSYVRGKIYGKTLDFTKLSAIITDINRGHYSDIQISSFLTACAGNRLNISEITDLTQAMVAAGDKLDWQAPIVVDKHCVGGLPGNRTTPIVVPIVAAFGLTMPKTSSRAITSPSGTADTMEVLANVELDFERVHDIVSEHHGCVVWGGTALLSPVDDILIRVEKALDLDSEGQLVASVISKKIAAGSTHVVIDIPVGATAKVRSENMGWLLQSYFEAVGLALGIKVKVIFTDGTQPVGRGIGPALEARDVVAVLKNDPDAPLDLRVRALELAGHIIEFAPDVQSGEGYQIAEDILSSGRAWTKFAAICAAQGGMKTIPTAKYRHQVLAKSAGVVTSIDNRKIALLAKLAGAPHDQVAGVDLHAPLNTQVSNGQPLFTIHADSQGELAYALNHLDVYNDIITIKA